MGAAAGPVASVSSFASLGFGLMGAADKADAARAQGAGINAQDQFQADLADENAQFGRLQANLTDVTMREQLTKTISNIDAIRASGNVDPASPTTAAIDDFNKMESNRQRMASVATSRTQANYDEASATYLRKAGSYAQVVANMNADSAMMGGIGQFVGGLGKMVLA